MKMAEMLAFWVRLLVVLCLAFVVVQAETMARVNAGRSVVRAVLRNAPDI